MHLLARADVAHEDGVQAQLAFLYARQRAFQWKQHAIAAPAWQGVIGGAPAGQAQFLADVAEWSVAVVAAEITQVAQYVMSQRHAIHGLWRAAEQAGSGAICVQDDLLAVDADDGCAGVVDERRPLCFSLPGRWRLVAQIQHGGEGGRQAEWQKA